MSTKGEPIKSMFRDQEAVYARVDGSALTETERATAPTDIKCSAHTPGPWEVQRFNDGDLNVMKAGTNWFIAAVGTMSPQADANLIAAAPELLGALKCVLLMIDAVSPSANVAERMRELVLPIIAKAEGR